MQTSDDRLRDAETSISELSKMVANLRRGKTNSLSTASALAGVAATPQSPLAVAPTPSWREVVPAKALSVGLVVTAWKKLDLSGVIPASCTRVRLNGYTVSIASPSELAFRSSANGSTRVAIHIEPVTLVSRGQCAFDMEVPVGPNRMIEYRVTGSDFQNLTVNLVEYQ